MAHSDFGTRLRELRIDAGLTIEALADASGVSVRAISDTERGRSRAPQPRTVAALAAGLRLAPAATAELTALARAGRAMSAPAGRPRACDLPRSSTLFVGRAAELAAISARVTASPPVPGRPAPPLVAVVHGPPGVGKTALAIRVAEQHRDRFPDGALYLDLRGTGPDAMAAVEVQAAVLKALGVHSRQIAGDEDARAAQLRALLAERRCLVILDNAGTERQVRGLLPGTGAGCVLVTSRRALTGLEAVDRFGLTPLRPDESAELLRCVGVVDDGSTAEVDAVARLCGHLPLALTIVGTRLADRSLSDLVNDLSDAERRLATLTSHDNGVEAAFAVSYTQLAGPARTLFRRLAHVPTVSFSAAAAAVLAGRGLFDAEDLLEELLDLGLLQPEGDDRYRLHDLIRLFAADRLRAEESASVRTATGRRMVEWYLDTAIAAGRWFEPAYGGPPADWHHPVPLNTPELAQAWLQAEVDGFVEAMRRAFDAGAYQRVVDVAEALHWYSDRTLSVDPWSVVYGLSRDAAARLPDRHQEATHTNYLSWALATCDSRYAEAEAAALEAYRIAVECGNLPQQAYALRYAGDAVNELGRTTEALELLRRSLVVAEAAGDHDGYVQTMVGVGLVLQDQGRAADAVEQFRRTLTDVARLPLGAGPARIAELTARMYLGRSLVDAGRWREAADTVESALPLAEAFGEVRVIAQARLSLCEAYAGLGDVDRARTELAAARPHIPDQLAATRWVLRAEAALAAVEAA